MNTIIMTSLLKNYIKEADDSRTAVDFGNINGIKDVMKSNIKKYDNLTYVASDKDAYADNDIKASAMYDSFNIAMPFRHYHLIDGRTSVAEASKILKQSDLIILGGGHVPTQNRFFEEYNFAKVLHEVNNAVILGISAGSMNMAEVVYCPPELDGEALDDNFVRFFPGLGLTTFNIYPHYNIAEPDIVDGKNIEKEYITPDSHKADIYLLPDDSYIELTQHHALIHGEAYLYHNGIKAKICNTDNTTEL